MKVNEVVLSELPSLKNMARGAAGAVKAGVKGQNMKQGAAQGIAAGAANDQINQLSKETVERWNKKTAGNPANKTDQALHQYMLQFRKHAPETDFPAPTPGTAQDVGKTAQYIRDLVAAELSAGEFGAKDDPTSPEGSQQAPAQGPKLEPGADNAKQVTTQDPKLLPVGTQFTDTQNNTYKWEGQQWTKLTKQGTWQAGTIKNKIAWDLYLQAVQQGKALAPINAKPDPRVAAKAQPQAQEPEQQAAPSAEFNQVKDWISQQEPTAVQQLLTKLGINK